MLRELPYCGSAPVPGELLARFNGDPTLIILLLMAALAHLWAIRAAGRGLRCYAIAGWVTAAAAFLSPLCALSVALFSARVAQHMLLVLIAAPLIALGWPPRTGAHSAWRLWSSVLFFFLSLWFWHMPTPYDATFASVPIYWAMHVTLFGGAVWFWRELLHHPSKRTAEALAAAALTSMQMGLLGALLTLSGHAFFSWHFKTTWAWNLTPLEDQQLGGIIMWVPGIALFLWTSIRSLVRLWASMDRLRAT